MNDASRHSDERLLDVLAARAGLVCAVGAGGKKTTLYRLIAAHPGRVGLTTTVLTAPFPARLGAERVVAETDALAARVAEAGRRHRVVAFARPSEKRGRLGGLGREAVRGIHARAGFEATFVKADGARMRWIKAPAEDEPAIPLGATTVLPVVSARILGARLGEAHAHRVARVAEVAGLRPGETVGPEHVARLLASPRGALQRVGEATVVPVINMVDDAGREAAARAAAERALALSDRFARVVLAAMRRAGDPIVAVVSR